MRKLWTPALPLPASTIVNMTGWHTGIAAVAPALRRAGQGRSHAPGGGKNQRSAPDTKSGLPSGTPLCRRMA